MNLTDQLARDEGRRARMYQDTVGKWTGGVGRNLSDVPFSDDEIDLMLANDIAARKAQLGQYAWFLELDEIRQASVINMSFMGVHKLLGFPSMIHYLSIKDFPNAALAALDSDWARELHYDPANPLASRPGRVAQQIKSGEWT